MGSFAGSIFQLLLGWVSTAASWLWSAVSGIGANGWFAWLLDNWLLLVILLCLGGVAVDLVVYLIRWQPYRVWRSFLRRIRGLDGDDWAEGDDAPRRRLIYADGTVEDVTEEEEVPEEAPAPQDAPVRPSRRLTPARRVLHDGSDEYIIPPFSDGGDAYHQPYYPPQWRPGDQPPQGGNNR